MKEKIITPDEMAKLVYRNIMNRKPAKPIKVRKVKSHKYNNKGICVHCKRSQSANEHFRWSCI